MAPAEVDTSTLDALVGDLRGALPSWVSLPLGERIALLAGARRRLGQEAQGIVEAGCAAQGLAPDDPWVRDLWVSIGPLVTYLGALEEVLSRIAAGREPVPAGAFSTRRDGQVVVDAAPATRTDWALFAPWGLRGQVWIQPGITTDAVRAGAGAAYRGSGFEDPGVALVLGAGNAAASPVMDAVHLLFSRGCVVALKLNPVNAYLRALLERILAEFLDAGWVRFVDGDATEAGYLAHHPGIDRVHMTGSAATYDAITWGTGEQAAANRAAGTPLLTKPFTAELGGVNPVIVVPGPWSASDVRLQADRIAAFTLVNCGHFCSAAQVLVLPERWDPGDALVEEIRSAMRSAPPREPYYPGTAAKVARAVAGRPHVRPLAPGDRRYLVDHLDPDSDDTLFRDEVFADVLGVVRLPAPTVASYLAAATEFANQRLAGDLSANVVVHPATARAEAPAVDRAIADLHYGAVGVNEWAGWADAFGYTTWGGFPGNTPEHVGSGIGVIGNAFMLPDPQKSVVTAAFHPRVKPLFALSHRTQADVLRGLMRFWASGDLRALPGILAASLRA